MRPAYVVLAALFIAIMIGIQQGFKAIAEWIGGDMALGIGIGILIGGGAIFLANKWESVTTRRDPGPEQERPRDLIDL